MQPPTMNRALEMCQENDSRSVNISVSGRKIEGQKNGSSGRTRTYNPPVNSQSSNPTAIPLHITLAL